MFHLVGSAGIEPAIFAMSRRRHNPQTTSPALLRIETHTRMILMPHETIFEILPSQPEIEHLPATLVLPLLILINSGAETLTQLLHFMQNPLCSDAIWCASHSTIQFLIQQGLFGQISYFFTNRYTESILSQIY